MKISIITICYNSSETIEDTIKSVISQDYTHIEYIIVDGQSSDNTLEIVNKYKDHVSKIVSEPDKGIYDAMNKGVELATGDFVGILNSDDLYANNTVITDVVNQLQKSKMYALYADLVYVDREDTDKVTRYWKSGEYVRNNFMKGWMPPHPTFFVRKKSYTHLGTYNLRLKSAADYDLMLRFLYKHNLPTTYLPKTIVKMRVGGQSNVTLKNRLKANKEDRLAWELNDLKPGLFTLIRKPLSKITQFIKKK